jgi:hypothetical protein
MWANVLGCGVCSAWLAVAAANDGSVGDVGIFFFVAYCLNTAFLGVCIVRGVYVNGWFLTEDNMA